jgi:outer membrane lipoprotein LolB
VSLRAVATLLAGALLSACTTLQPVAPTASSESLSGRMSVKVDATPSTPARSVSASFELQGTPQDGKLDLSTPLGTTIAQARWSGRKALLTTGGEQRSYPDLDSLTQDMLGESLPIVALFDWLRGRAWDGAPSRPAVPPADAGFQQLGWDVNLARFDEGWVIAQRAQRAQAPAVVVRARIDRP